MEVDPPSLTIGSSSRSAPAENLVLLKDKQIKLWDDWEKEVFKKLKDREFALTPAFDLAQLISIGMDSEFDLIFKTIRWEDAWEINEQGCRLLTIEFLCTLQTTESEVSFRFFRKEFSIPWKNFSGLLGFST
jgi:hypothetical protein